MTQADYYDYAPTVVLGRSVACTGHPGTNYREIIYDLAALTGLPLHDLDRRVEHETGQSLWAYARQHGAQALQELETELLAGILAQAPPGLIVLGEGARLDAEQLALVRGRAAIVFFQLPLAACYWSLRRRVEERGGMLMHPLLPDQLNDAHDLEPLCRQLQPALVAADHVVPLQGAGVHESVLALQGELPTLGLSPASL